LRGGAFLADVLQAIAERGRSFVLKSAPDSAGGRDFGGLCDSLLKGRGEASGLALAAEILGSWRGAPAVERLAILQTLAERFGPDEERLERAVAAFLQTRNAQTRAELHAAAEPRRQEVIRRLNMAQGATPVLLQMREETLRQLGKHPELAGVEADFFHLLSSWFNRGFLMLRRIDWSTSANVLEKIIKYEAVHAIRSWDDLQSRLVPEDRRCFAFFHPQLADEPLIFVEVALMRGMPASISEVLGAKREQTPVAEATTAVFYSISNCQAGLRGVSFGNFLLKQVIEELGIELPSIRNYVTLSPVPGFAEWLERKQAESDFPLGGLTAEVMPILHRAGWADDAAAVALIGQKLPALAADYLVNARAARGGPADPVARFHLGNGARLERLNILGDRSPKGMSESYGLMVNYRYKVEDVVKNHELFASKDAVVTAPAVRRQLMELSPPARAGARRNGAPTQALRSTGGAAR
jgi:malonyl-CoA decarboxylase